MKVLVTGGTSLLARRTVEILHARGDEVVCLQRHPSGTETNEVLGDIRDPAVLRRSLAGCDAVIHAAAKVGVVGTWAEFCNINVDGTVIVLDAARAAGVAKFVHVSTPAVAHHGESIVGGTAAPAETGRRGSAWYAESKAMAEQRALDSASAGLPLVVIRPHLVWGPRDEQLVGRIVERARAGRLALVGGGTALVDTTYIDCAAEALVAALDAVEPAAACNGRAYVIANGEPRPIRDLVLGICAAAGIDIEPRSVPRSVALAAGSVFERVSAWRRSTDEPILTRFLAEQLGTAHWFDPRPARDDLGWTPSVSIDEGLRRLTAWFDSGG